MNNIVTIEVPLAFSNTAFEGVTESWQTKEH